MGIDPLTITWTAPVTVSVSIDRLRADALNFRDEGLGITQCSIGRNIALLLTSSAGECHTIDGRQLTDVVVCDVVALTRLAAHRIHGAPPESERPLLPTATPGPPPSASIAEATPRLVAVPGIEDATVLSPVLIPLPLPRTQADPPSNTTVTPDRAEPPADEADATIIRMVSSPPRSTASGLTAADDATVIGPADVMGGAERFTGLSPSAADPIVPTVPAPIVALATSHSTLDDTIVKPIDDSVTDITGDNDLDEATILSAATGPGPFDDTPAPHVVIPAHARGGLATARRFTRTHSAVEASMPPAPNAPAATTTVTVMDARGHTTHPVGDALYVGRAPVAPPDAPSGARGLAVVVSPAESVSATHLRLRYHAGQVLVWDMWSTNGTTVIPPGSAPFRLGSGEELPVSIGTWLDLGDGVRISIGGPGGT